MLSLGHVHGHDVLGHCLVLNPKTLRQTLNPKPFPAGRHRKRRPAAVKVCPLLCQRSDRLGWAGAVTPGFHAQQRYALPAL